MASKARLVSQCPSFLCRLYLGPLFSKDSSFLEKVMSLLFTTLVKKVWGSWGLLFVAGLVYVICHREFCIWTILFSAVCLRLYPECSAKSFPMC